MRVMAIDPSGNFTNTKGKTGWAYFKNGKLTSYGEIDAKYFPTRAAYFQHILNTIKQMNPQHLVVENFRVYADKAAAQINSEMETPRILGAIEVYAYQKNIPLTQQNASLVKTRWADDILDKKGILPKDVKSPHIKDAIRHGAHFVSFTERKKVSYEPKT